MISPLAVAAGGLFGAVGAPQRERIYDAIATIGRTGFGRLPITAPRDRCSACCSPRLPLRELRVIVPDKPFNASKTDGRRPRGIRSFLA